MLIGPELMALRVDDTPQRRIQQRLLDQLEAWREATPGSELEAELPRFSSGAGLESLSTKQRTGERGAITGSSGALHANILLQYEERLFCGCRPGVRLRPCRVWC